MTDKESLAQPEQEPCGWQFYQDGKWHNGMETNNHRANTERAGIPVRDVYPAPQRTEQEPVAYLCENAVGHKYFRWKKPTSIYKPIALYTHPPQRTEEKNT